MKKKIAAIALVLTLATVGIASARGGMGGGMGGGMNMNCPQMQGQMGQPLDKAAQDKLDAFQRDTQALRKQIVMKHAEMRAMMSSDTPNPAAAAKISGELFDLQATMQDKAKAAGVAAYLGGGCGMGMGMGHGGKMGGQGGGPGMKGGKM